MGFSLLCHESDADRYKAMIEAYDEGELGAPFINDSGGMTFQGDHPQLGLDPDIPRPHLGEMYGNYPELFGKLFQDDPTLKQPVLEAFGEYVDDCVPQIAVGADQTYSNSLSMG